MIYMNNNDKFNFYKYLVCLSYLYNKNLRNLLNVNDQKQSVQSLVINSNLCVDSKVLNALSYDLNTSVHNFQLVLRGSLRPIVDLLNDAKYFSAESYRYLMKVTQKVHKSKTVPVRHVINFNQIHFPKIKDGRKALKNYLRCLTYLHGITLKKLLHDMGYTYSQFNYFLKKKSTPDVVNNLRQLPFTSLKVNLDNVKAILNDQNRPIVDLIKKLSKQVKGRQSLKTFIYAVTYVYGTDVLKLSRQMDQDAKYINRTISQGTSEKISAVFTKLAKLMKFPDIYLQIALAHANLRSAHHAYLNDMKFVTRYIHAPVGYHERYRMHRKDRQNISQGFRRIYEVIDHDLEYNAQDFQHQLWIIILGWGHMFGFSAKKFAHDNFINFRNPDKHTRVKQGQHSYVIKRLSDWIVILHKFHQQLNFVKHSFNLPKVQKSDYANYLYVGEINVGNPLIENANRELAQYEGQRLQLTAHFYKTSIKVLNNGSNSKAKEYYKPTIELVDIKHNHVLVAGKVWFNYTKGFTKLGQMKRGDLISLTARVKRFSGGHAGKNTLRLVDYGLGYPAGMKSIRRVHARDFVPVPSDQAALTGYAIAQNKTAGYDFSIGNYGYARYCMKSYDNWRRQQRSSEK